MSFVDPKVDIAFKKIFGDEQRKHVLISLLNAVMDKDIVEVEILNPYQVPKLSILKFTILDIKARDIHGREFIVEMQANPHKYVDKRALDYVARAYVNQLDGGMDYSEHQPVYFIGVLNFHFFNSQGYLSRHFLLNMETQEQEIQDFELYFIELTKFNKTLSELEHILDKWIYFLKELDHLPQLPEELAQEPAINEAAQIANRATWTKDEIEAYEYGLREEARELKMIQQLKEKDQILKEKDQILEEKEQKLEEQQKALEEQQKALRDSIKLLHQLGQSPVQIAANLHITEEIVQKYLAS